jgi:hypothetical protein
MEQHALFHNAEAVSGLVPGLGTACFLSPMLILKGLRERNNKKFGSVNMEIIEEKLNSVRAIHYAKTYLDFISEMIDERSTDFDAMALESIEKKCLELEKQIDTILHRRGHR